MRWVAVPFRPNAFAIAAWDLHARELAPKAFMEFALSAIVQFLAIIVAWLPLSLDIFSPLPRREGLGVGG